ncbi:alpha/beta hydrolase [Bacteroides fragilis]|mgnify:FL=1|uniref:Alpha/beta hydrolase n=3 Tax=Bacteroides TaxID=816 RepID=A0AAP9NA96_BACFG|nr:MULTISPECIES: alpha/beta hydrolase [Bacteroides]EFR52822.1 hypothetical protein BFAG_01517 [Bacteroides fragilis 3_1_12]MBM6511166.1 alpha/beta hydrolase [Bacteroides fragilis]MBY2898439.1 1,4-beta-xylanase [Bacteroides fragilis]MCE8615254.1 alpha/beta hydrolase [Bacteroides fragilis]MCE8623271.1 alpha/beta hydrolase [Bacteroides fragilis]
MKYIAAFLVLFIATFSFAQKPVELPLWPNGAPNDNGLDAQQPTITVYRPSHPNGTTVIMCPGGAYVNLAMAHEGHDMAAWFNAQGITYAVLKYRMPNGNSQVPLSDVEEAIRIVRRHAKEWNIRPERVGIMGASAGGHLASTLATHYSSEETRPDFQILLYPVITMDRSFTHMGSHDSLIGKDASAETEERYSNEKQVTPNTPQAFIVLSSDDSAVVPANGVCYYLALQKQGVPASMHIYPTGGHGWGFHDSFVYKRQWTEELEKWLRDGVKFSR